jgi:eukaryotic-like serine/threonine-protein kinase
VARGELGNHPAMALSPGATLGSRYALECKVGAGGYSDVWRARDAVLDRPVAIKLLHAEHTRDAETLRRFRTEAQLAARLSDPNVARVYDFLDSGPDGIPYLVMEYIDGPTLAQILRRGPLGAYRTMDVLAQAASGLRAAHAAGLVHRDIKPSNIMLAPGNVVKITDFGLSHTLASAPVTRTGMIAGTPGFLAPERAVGARATPASDLYSLGVVGYECLSGHPPFSGTPLEVALAHRDGEFPPLPTATPQPVTAFIAQLTAKDPGGRPDGAGLVARQAASLRSILRGPAADGAAALRGAATGSAGRAGRAAPLGAGTQPLTEVARPAHDTLIVPRDEPEPGPARPRRRKAAVAWVIGVAGLAAAIAIAAEALAPGQAGPHAVTNKPGISAASAIDVSASALVGEQVSLARQQLRGQGFHVRVQWQPTDQQAAATVLAVQPTGPQAPGSLITLVAAIQSGHGHHHHDHGHGGDGNNQGGGTGD